MIINLTQGILVEWPPKYSFLADQGLFVSVTF